MPNKHVCFIMIVVFQEKKCKEVQQSWFDGAMRPSMSEWFIKEYTTALLIHVETSDLFSYFLGSHKQSYCWIDKVHWISCIHYGEQPYAWQGQCHLMTIIQVQHKIILLLINLIPIDICNSNWSHNSFFFFIFVNDDLFWQVLDW